MKYVVLYAQKKLKKLRIINLFLREDKMKENKKFAHDLMEALYHNGIGKELNVDPYCIYSCCKNISNFLFFLKDLCLNFFY